MSQSFKFQEKALELVVLDAAETRMDGLLFTNVDRPVTKDDFYVVWFSKTLQNWKALISTDLESGVYYEVTYNGDRAESYVDRYQKKANRVVPDTYFADSNYIHLTD